MNIKLKKAIRTILHFENVLNSSALSENQAPAIVRTREEIKREIAGIRIALFDEAIITDYPADIAEKSLKLRQKLSHLLADAGFQQEQIKDVLG